MRGKDANIIPKGELLEYVGKKVWYDSRFKDLLDEWSFQPITSVVVKAFEDDEKFGLIVRYGNGEGFDCVSDYGHDYIFWDRKPTENRREKIGWHLVNGYTEGHKDT